MDEEAKKRALLEMLRMKDPEPKGYSDTGRKAENPGDVLDSYIGGPLRAGMAKASDVQVGEDTGFFSLKPTIEGFKAIREQFGKDPKTAPTGKVVAEKMGMSSLPFSQTPGLKEIYRKKGEPVEAFDIRPEEGGMFDVSPAGITGFGVELGTDPLMLAPQGKAFKGIDVLNPALHREASAKAFSKAVEKARATRPDVVENVSQYTPDEYAKMRTFLAGDGKSGFALKPTDKGEELVNVFAAEKGLNRGDKIVSEAVNRGAQTLDAFDGYLPKLYEKHGFKSYKREPNFTPGGPDVVYMSQPNNPALKHAFQTPVDDVTSKTLLSKQEIAESIKKHGIEEQIQKRADDIFEPRVNRKITPEELEAIKAQIPEINAGINSPNRGKTVPPRSFDRLRKIINEREIANKKAN